MKTTRTLAVAAPLAGIAAICLLAHSSAPPAPVATPSVPRAMPAPTTAAITRPSLPSREIECLASAIWHEAGNQPRRGQIAIAEVVLARTRNPIFPSKPCAVIAQHNQFSFVHKGRIPAIPMPDVRAEMRRLATLVVAGAERSGLRGALFFHAKYVHPGWRYARIGAIGDHVFYRLI